MSDDDRDTPPPYRTKTDASMQIPIDPLWFHEWRRETAKGFESIRRDVSTLESRLHESQISLMKHDEQIGALAQGAAETDRAVDGLTLRVAAIEKVEDRRAEALMRDEKSLVTRAKETAFISAVCGLVAGAGMFLWFLFTIYMKARHP